LVKLTGKVEVHWKVGRFEDNPLLNIQYTPSKPAEFLEGCWKVLGGLRPKCCLNLQNQSYSIQRS